MPARRRRSPARWTRRRCSPAGTRSPRLGRRRPGRRGSTAPASTWSAATAGSPASAGRRHRPRRRRDALTARHAVAVVHRQRAPSSRRSPGCAEASRGPAARPPARKKVPGRLLVVGGGVVGCEMATAWQALGSQVTLLVARRRGCCRRMEPFAGELVAASLREAGRRRAPRRRRHRGPAGRAATVVRDRRTTASCEATRSCSRPAARPAPRTSAWRPSAWSPGAGSTSTTRCRCRHRLALRGRRRQPPRAAHPPGQVPGPASPARRSLPAPRRAARRPPLGADGPPPTTRRAAGGVHRPRGRLASGLTLGARRSGPGLPHRVVEYDLGKVAGAALFADGYRGRAADRRPGPGGPARRDLRRPGRRRTDPLRDVAVVGEVPLDRLWHAVPSYPTISEVWLRLLETYRG